MITITNREDLFNRFQKLTASASPLFGKMTPQQMIEHLILTIRVSSGKDERKLVVDPEKAEKIKAFTIMTDQDIPMGVKSPLYREQLPPLEYTSLTEAIEVLRKELTYFDEYYQLNPANKHIQPLMGELNHQEWVRFHSKHFKHHLKQFDLV
jgi:oxepin-CoA hydrolase/3-oxo-5,6-dehydrosuberyl-CoA semialdehyde dehydrogenase